MRQRIVFFAEIQFYKKGCYPHLEMILTLDFAENMLV